jgi:hypothetical protein
MVQNFKERHIAQHIEFLNIDTSSYTEELNYIKSSIPIFLLSEHLEMVLRHNLYLYNFSVSVFSDIPRLDFNVCGASEDLAAYKKETCTENPTEEEIEQAILRYKNDPDLAEFYNTD